MIQFAFLAVTLLSPSEFDYVLKPIPVESRTDIEVTFEAALGSGEQKILLPNDFYTTPELYKHVVTFEGLDGTKVRAGEKPDERIVTPNATGLTKLRYAMKFDPADLENSAFGPNTSKQHFHLAGCHWMLRIGKADERHRHDIRILKPKGWNLYSNLSATAERFTITSSYEDLITSIVGGGSRPSGRFEVRGKPVQVFIQGEYLFKVEEITQMVEKIFVGQREWFDDYDFPFYTVAISEKPNVIAGTCVDNAFICFAKESITQDELLLLLAHEMFHTWLPGKIRMREPIPTGNRIQINWFDEGFTEYFARKMLHEHGMMTTERFVELFNKDIRHIADNLYRNASFETQAEAAKNGRFMNAHQKLAYYRGALIASAWEARARKSGGLKKMIREMFEEARKTGYRLTDTQLFGIAEGYAPGARADWQTYILHGKSLILEPDAFEGYELRDVMLPRFEPGFNVDETVRTRKLTGVIEGGPAWKVGAREAMAFVSATNLNRFSNAWSAERKTVLKVKDGEVEKTFEYLPLGEAWPVKQYVKK